MFDIVARAALPGERGEVTTPRSIDNRIRADRREAVAGLRAAHAVVLKAMRQSLDCILEIERRKLWKAAGYSSLGDYLDSPDQLGPGEGERWERAVRLVTKSGARRDDVVRRMQNWGY